MKKTQTPQKRKKRKVNGAICNNYLKPCPIMGRCQNCKHRKFHIVYATGERVLVCGIGKDLDGDHKDCFLCSSEGYCKKDYDD